MKDQQEVIISFTDDVGVKQQKSSSIEIVQVEDESKSKKKKIEKAVSFGTLWRYASCKDIIWLVIGSLASYLQGWTLPLLLVFFGEAINELSSNFSMTTIEELASNFVYVGIGAGVLAFVSRSVFIYIGVKMTSAIKKEYVKAICKQEMAWHDRNPAASLEIRLAEASQKIQTALGIKLGTAINQMGTFTGGLVFAFYYSPTLSGVTFAAMIPQFFLMGAMISTIEAIETNERDIYESAGVLAHEVLTLTRVVSTFGTQDSEKRIYNQLIGEVSKKGKKFALRYGILSAMPDAAFQLMYALVFWYGGTMIREQVDGLMQGDILQVFFNVLMAAMTGALAMEYVKHKHTGQVAAFKIFEVIDRVSKIDALSKDGVKEKRLQGNIEVTNLEFAYPISPDKTVLKGFSFNLQQGKTTALVGHSGSGKSTIINMLMRFYDPISGSIKVGGKHLSEYNVEWLRQSIGLVAQQPTLLPGTIRSNIALGKGNATEKEITDAAKLANAHDFITSFPDGYDTEVGSLGGKLSGGQRQRIAIARTMIANPSILLLDEATSALDSKSESTFQDMLAKTSANRATIVVAHRLSTIRDADEILVVDHGHIVERGTHSQLMEMQGAYFDLHNQGGASEDTERKASVFIDEAENSELDKSASYSDAVRIASGTSTKSAFSTKSDGTISANLQANPEETTPLTKTDISSSNAFGDTELTKEEKKAVAKFASEMSGGDFWWMATSYLGAAIDGASYAVSVLILGLVLGACQASFLEKEFSCAEANLPDANTTYGSLKECEFELLSSTDRDIWGCSTQLGSDSLPNASMVTVVKECTHVVCTEIYPCSSDYSEPADPVRLNPLIYAFIACFFGICLGRFLQFACQFVARTRLTFRLRKLFFAYFLDKSAAWTDHYTTSNTTEALSVQVNDVGKLTHLRKPMLVKIALMTLTSLAFAFAYCWQLALVVLAVLPLVVASNTVESKLMFTNDTSDEKEGPAKRAGQTASILIENFQIITALGRSGDRLNEYETHVDQIVRMSINKAINVGLAGFLSQFIMFSQWGLAFWFGGKQLLNGSCDYTDMNVAFFCVLFPGFQAGQEFAMLPDQDEASKNVNAALKLYHHKTEDDLMLEDEAKNPDKLNNKKNPITKGRIEFKDVVFSYPTRSDAVVLNKLNLTIEPGQTVAIVGGSGSGKSTVISLMQKLYQPNSGTILVDGQDIRKTCTSKFREQIAVVPQEPKLFSRTIAENISYRPQSIPVTEGQIVEAATIANAAGFINEQEGKYQYNVGKFGERLSGGQCQRVAIARSVFGENDIKVVLLDEATSALDNESQVLVQDALEKTSQGRTTIVVAHRLSTIRSADKIFVLNQGEVAESGTYEQLIEKNGLFAELSAKDATVIG